jgi:hypothetical protein
MKLRKGVHPGPIFEDPGFEETERYDTAKAVKA